MKQNVFLIVEDKTNKVFARVFSTEEKANSVLQQRDDRTGEKLYTDCHVIEREVE